MKYLVIIAFTIIVFSGCSNTKVVQNEVSPEVIMDEISSPSANFNEASESAIQE